MGRTRDVRINQQEQLIDEFAEAIAEIIVMQILSDSGKEAEGEKEYEADVYP